MQSLEEWLAVGFAAMTNSVDHNTAGLVLNRVKDSVITDPSPIRVGRSFQLLGVRGSWVLGKGFHSMLDTSTYLNGQAAELSSGSRRVEDGVHEPLSSALRRSVHLGHRDECIMPMGLDVGEVFQVLQQFDQSPELAQWELDSSPSSCFIHDVLGMEFRHRGPLMSLPYHSVWRSSNKSRKLLMVKLEWTASAESD